MPHKQIKPGEGIEKFVEGFYKQYPENRQAIDAYLKAHRLPDGRLENDDDIILDLRQLAKREKWSVQKAAATRAKKSGRSKG